MFAEHILKGSVLWKVLIQTLVCKCRYSDSKPLNYEEFIAILKGKKSKW